MQSIEKNNDCGHRWKKFAYFYLPGQSGRMGLAAFGRHNSAAGMVGAAVADCNHGSVSTVSAAAAEAAVSAVAVVAVVSAVLAASVAVVARMAAGTVVGNTGAFDDGALASIAEVAVAEVAMAIVAVIWVAGI